jgi:hypothetical protein
VSPVVIEVENISDVWMPVNLKIKINLNDKPIVINKVGHKYLQGY